MDVLDEKRLIVQKDALDWLLYSSIHITEKNSSDCGSFRAWFNCDNNTFSYIYPEITGYALSLLCFCKELYKENKFDYESNLTKNYLISNYCKIDNKNTFNFQDVIISNSTSNRIYVFDLAMILKGLLQSYYLNKDETLVKYCIALGNWLLNMQKKDGSFYAYYDKSIKKPISSFVRWSTQSGTFHMKIAIPLLQLYNISGDNRYKKSAEKLYMWIKNLEIDNGRFITDVQQHSTFLHAYCYTLEGIMFFSKATNNSYLSDELCTGIDWLENLYYQNDFLPSVVFNDKKVLLEERSDILAQTIRLLSICENLGFKKEKFKNLLIDKLCNYQCNSDCDNSNGGLRFRSKINNKNTDGKWNHINTWSTLVGIQALSCNKNTFYKCLDFFI